MVSSLKAIDTILPHGLLPKTPINFFGKYMSGKTLLTLQEACFICRKENGGGNILLFDVDGGADLFVSEWKTVFEQRFGFEGEIFILPSFNTQRYDPRQKFPYFDLNIYEYFGIKAQVDLSAKGKANFTPHHPCKSKVDDYIQNKNVKVLIIDSFSQIYKDVFLGIESFGDRARAEDFLYGLIKTVALKFPHVYLFLNHHSSVNPITNQVGITGGNSVLQNSKMAIYITKPREKESFGEIHLYRYPNVPPWFKFSAIEYSDLGIVDIKLEEKSEESSEKVD